MIDLNRQTKIEVLAPAGSIDSMKAAFCAGADAVYMGGSRFGARAYADNPQEEDLKWAIDYAHLHDKKIYLTMNTLFKNHELEEEAFSFLKPYYEEGLDGIIIQDMGLLSMLKECFPQLSIHGSTQMTITGKEMAGWLEKQGLERIVLSRELSLKEIETIRKSTNMELEVFVQGALCYCYSGQCLMSSFIGGRSGNRGRCAQPCRLPYQVGKNKISDHILSPKDICTLNDIPNLVNAGINSFKIEGRMKKPEYAALTAYLYRYYVDKYLEFGKDGYSVDQKDVERLMDLYNRGGFSCGYLHVHNHSEMIFRERPNHMGVSVGKLNKKSEVCLTTDLNVGDVLEIRSDKGISEHQWTMTRKLPKGSSLKVNDFIKAKKGQQFNAGRFVYRVRNQKLIDELHQKYLQEDLKQTIEGTLTIVSNLPVSLKLKWKDLSVQCEGYIAETAKNQPMSVEQLKKPILKTGNTPFVFSTLNVDTDGLCYVPNSQLNELRRNALMMLEKEWLNRFCRYDARIPYANKSAAVKTNGDKTFNLNVMLSGMETLKKGKLIQEYSFVKGVYVELHEAVQDDFKTVKVLKNSGKKIYFALPFIFREKDRERILKNLSLAKPYSDGWLVRQLEMAVLVRNIYQDDSIIMDSSIYSLNKRAKNFLESQFNAKLTAPVELNYSELKALNCDDMELIIYGHQNLMVSAQCIKKTQDGCTGRTELIQLTDRQHKHFYVYNECEYCYNKIYNGLPTVLFDKKKELNQLEPASLRMHFTMENECMIREIIESYESIFIHHMPVKNNLREFTRGHFTRGIE